MKRGISINIGSVSILFIFVLLCITTFSTLSLVSAKADYKLSSTSATFMSDFYSGDTKAEETLASIDLLLQSIPSNLSKEDYFNTCISKLNSIGKEVNYKLEENLTIQYISKINENNEIQVALDVIYPALNSRYKIVKWQTVNTVPWVEDNTLNLWNNEE